MPAKLVLIPILLCFSAITQAQTPATNPTPPTTPADYFRLARQQSELHQDGAKPFRLTATFTSTDAQGKVRTGQYSELWISKDRWKREISIGDYREASATVSGTYYQFASSEQEDSAAADVLENLTPEIPEANDADTNSEWVLTREKLGGVELTRVARMMHFKDRGDMPVAAYFFTPQIGFVRGEQSLTQSAYYNGLHSALGRIVPFNVTLRFEGKHSTDIKITDFSDPGSPTDNALIIPEAAKSNVSTDIPQIVNSGIIQGMIVKRVQPVFPEGARRAHESGDVELHIAIGRDGRVRNIQIAKATRADFAASAITAVRDYIYKPFTLNGVPTSVSGTITVRYLSRQN